MEKKWDSKRVLSLCAFLFQCPCPIFLCLFRWKVFVSCFCVPVLLSRAVSNQTSCFQFRCVIPKWAQASRPGKERLGDMPSPSKTSSSKAEEAALQAAEAVAEEVASNQDDVDKVPTQPMKRPASKTKPKAKSKPQAKRLKRPACQVDLANISEDGNAEDKTEPEDAAKKTKNTAKAKDELKAKKLKLDEPKVPDDSVPKPAEVETVDKLSRDKGKAYYFHRNFLQLPDEAGLIVIFISFIVIRFHMLPFPSFSVAFLRFASGPKSVSRQGLESRTENRTCQRCRAEKRKWFVPFRHDFPGVTFLVHVHRKNNWGTDSQRFAAVFDGQQTGVRGQLRKGNASRRGD